MPITRLSVSSWVANSVGSTPMAIMMSGVRNNPIRNALLLTFSKYSQRATAITLLMTHPPRPPERQRDRRRYCMKMVCSEGSRSSALRSSTRGFTSVNDVPHLCAALQFQLGATFIQQCVVNSGQVRHECPVAVKFQVQRVLPVPLLHIPHGTAKNNLSSVDEAKRVAQPFRLIHLMGRKDDGLFPLLQFLQDIFQQYLVHRIQAGERLVKHYQLRIVNNRADELHLLLVSLGKFIRAAEFLTSPVPTARASARLPSGRPPARARGVRPDTGQCRSACSFCRVPAPPEGSPPYSGSHR